MYSGRSGFILFLPIIFGSCASAFQVTIWSSGRIVYERDNMMYRKPGAVWFEDKRTGLVWIVILQRGAEVKRLW